MPNSWYCSMVVNCIRGVMLRQCHLRALLIRARVSRVCTYCLRQEYYLKRSNMQIYIKISQHIMAAYFASFLIARGQQCSTTDDDRPWYIATVRSNSTAVHLICLVSQIPSPAACGQVCVTTDEDRPWFIAFSRSSVTPVHSLRGRQVHGGTVLA